MTKRSAVAFTSRRRRILTGALLCLALAGFSRSRAEEPGDFDDFADFEGEIQNRIEATKVADPLAPLNRGFFWVNDKLYFWVLKPVALGYRKIIPEKGRISVGNFFDNLEFPLRFVNNVLQLKWQGAGTELGRFGVNSTAGVLGLFDPARKWWGWRPANEDFGQTFACWGVGPGISLHLPLLGSSNLRDAIGKIPEYFVDPITYVEPWEAGFAAGNIDRVNFVSLRIGIYEDLKKDAIDPYRFFQDAYEQRRQKLVKE